MHGVSLFCFALLALPVFSLPGAEQPLRRQLYGNSFGVPGQDATYDYVILGGGTAGLTIASRLAANPQLSVAVIEAGGFYEIDNGNGSVIPALAPVQHGANNRRLHYAQGKTLGGSSARNFLAYHRGTEGSYKQWADAVGDDSYLFPNFLKYFKRSCQVTPPNLEKRFPTNGTVDFNPAAFDNSLGGPLQVSWPNYAAPIATWAQRGMRAVGILPIRGFDSGNLIGSAWVANTLNPTNEQRSSSQTSYLNRAIQNTSIVVYTQTLGQKILFDSAKTAYGVSVNTAGEIYTLRANKQIILSAGAFQSPHLLMLSGIGPRQTLQNFNIPVVADLPGVGQNMWDQPYFGISFRVNVETSTRLSKDPLFAIQASKDYLLNGTGILTGVASILGFEKLPARSRANFTMATKSKLRTFSRDWPEIEYLVENTFDGYTNNRTGETFADPYEYATITAILVAPLSRGNVTISSANPADPPVINPNWLTDPADAEVAVAAFKRLRDIWQNMNGTTIGSEFYPGTATVRTDAQILAYVRNALIQIWHASATCKMGRAGDRNAVVDSRGRVFGVQGLRVVDASVFPVLPPGHPQATVYALGEKIVDDILRGT
ncbi:MAG: hypothetical protein Q9200_004165 [Gallowayella weberi]